MDIDRLLVENHGIVRVSQLRAVGIGLKETRDLVARGVLIRIRLNWYRSASHVEAPVLRAVQCGGALSCISALKLHGLWQVSDARVHLRRPAAISDPLPRGLTACRPSGRQPPVRRAVDPVAMALLCAGRCRPADEFVVLLDSALNQRRLSRADLEGLLAEEPLPIRNALRRIDRAESGTETLARLRLRARRITVRSQVVIPGVGRVDLLVGDRLVIEVDSFEHHAQGAGYEQDRPRDQQLLALGYLVVRVSYLQVMFRWEEAEAAILTLIRRGDHRWPRQRK